MASPNPILAQAAATANQTPVVAPSAATPAPSNREPNTETPAVSDAANARLSVVETALASSAVRLSQSTAQLEQGQAATASATDVIQQSIGDVTAAKQISTMAKQTAELQFQNNTNRLFQAAGGIDEQVRLMTELSQDGKQVSKLLDERTDIMNDEFSGVFIIDRIINGFRAIPNKQQLKDATAERDQTVTQIRNVTGAQESFASVNNLNKRTLNDAVIEANYKGIAAEGAIKGAEVALANIQSNATAMSRLVTADQQQVSNLLQGYRIEGEAQSRAIAAERVKFQREDMARQREAWEQDKPRKAAQLESLQLQLKDQKDPTRIAAVEAQRSKVVRDIEQGLLLEKQQVTDVQRAQSLAGSTVETAETIAFKVQSPTSRERYIRLQEIGGADKLVLGATPFEALTNLSIIDPVNSAKPTVGTKTLAAIQANQARAYTAAGVRPPKDPVSLEAGYDTAARAHMTQLASDIKEGDQSNPYQAPPMEVLERSANVQNTALWQSVLAPMKMTEAVPQRILDAAVSGVLSKVVTPEQAADGIDAIFTAAAMYNNTNEGGFSRVGLSEFNQTTYNTTVRNPVTAFDILLSKPVLDPINAIGIALDIGDSRAAAATRFEAQFSSQASIDLMDKSAVQNLIVRLLSSQKPVAPATPQEER